MDHFVGLFCLLLFDPQRLYAGFGIIVTDYRHAFQLAFALVPLLKNRGKALIESQRENFCFHCM